MSLHWFPYYAKEFQAKAAHLTFAEEGCYIRLLRLCWFSPGCDLPKDERWIFRKVIARSPDDEEITRSILEEFFKLKNGRWHNPKLTEIWIKQTDAHSKRVEAGKKSKKAKSLKSKGSGSSKATTMLEQQESEPEPEQEPDSSVEDEGGENAPPAHWRPILERCIEAAKPALAEANIPLMDFSRIRIWMEDKNAPCDLELDILPTLRTVSAKAKGRNVRGWGYFENAIIQQRDRRIAGLPKPQEPKNESRNYTAKGAGAKSAGSALAQADRVRDEASLLVATEYRSPRYPGVERK